MHEPPPVGRVERVGDLTEERKSPLRRQRALLCEQRTKVGAVDVARGEVELAVCLPGGVHGEDAGVVDGRCESGLAQEALPERGVACELWRDQLQRDGPVETLLSRSIDDAHPAPPDLALDAVAGELGPYPDGHLSLRFSTLRSTT